MDYCCLNSLTKKDSYPLPRIDNSMQCLGGSQYFSAMDLASGYWQIDLSPEDCEKSTLITSDRLFKPTRMPQGLCNAPATFQRAMDSVLRDLTLSCVLVYLDNITVFSVTFVNHLKHLHSVFQCLQEARLKLKPSKCSFFKEQLKFLGHEVTKSGIKPMNTKVEAIDRMAPHLAERGPSLLGHGGVLLPVHPRVC